MKDKEFKAKNKDTNFSKPQKADTVLGRHNQIPEQKTDLSSSKKNRMYQQRQAEPEQPIDVTETKTDISQNSVSDTVNTKTENSVYEQNAFDTKESVAEITEIHSEHYTELVAPAEPVKSRQRKQADKFRADNNVSVLYEHNSAETPIEKTGLLHRLIQIFKRIFLPLPQRANGTTFRMLSARKSRYLML